MTGTTGLAGLAMQLRTQTREDHERAETAPFVGALLDGAVGLDGYIDYLGQLSHVYAALETAADAVAGDPVVAAFADPALDRVPALANDLTQLIGPDWAARTPATPATASYCQRIRDVAATWPPGFVAHHYTRYLGDLAGGQVIGVAVRRLYGLDETATSFFRFDAIESVKRFRDAYRARLDATGWDAAEQDRVVAEAQRAFRHNHTLFVELGERHGVVPDGARS